ncbi:MAG TPA: cupin domain-containing protein [Sedimentisphaerales bacterium]|nr:cupin domain-containing protein [Sedimentisphaerales bacterium]
MQTAKQIIEHFNMKPLPFEGGYYIETYRASEAIAKAGLAERYNGPRNHSTCILYLLTSEMKSKIHRVKSDEIFHFYTGSAVTMFLLGEAKKSKIITLGNDLSKQQMPQVIVPKGVWQGCYIEKGDFALMGTTVSPGFEFDDFEIANRNDLLKQYPDEQDLIIKLTD